MPVALTDRGRESARGLGEQIANVPIELCVHTRFGRTRETAGLALEGRDVEMTAEPLLDDIDIGELEGDSIDDYRAWKREHTRADPFPGGESLDDAARRYAQAFRKLAATDTRGATLVVCHEIALRYALNATAGSKDLDGPTHDVLNATPYLFDDAALELAADRIDSLVGR